MSDRAKVILAAVVCGLVMAGVAAYFFAKRGAGPAQAEPEAAALPGPGSETYKEMVGAFYGGLAAVEVDAYENAKQKLGRATELVPGEPAAWADLALARMRSNDDAGAEKDLERAGALAPESGEIEALRGLLEGRRGNFARAIIHYRHAAELSPDDLRVRYALAQEIERDAGMQAGPESVAEPLKLTGEILAKRPDNLMVLLDRARFAAKAGDAKALGQAIERIELQSRDWPERTRESLAILKKAAADPREAPMRVAFLKNVLVRTPAYQKGLAEVSTPPGVVGVPVRDFLKMTPPRPTAAPADAALAYATSAVSDKGGEHWSTLLAAPMTGEGPPSVFVADARALRRADGTGSALDFPGGSAKPSPHALMAADLNSDYRLDLVAAGGAGVRIYRQSDNGVFADVTPATKLDAALLRKPAFGAWAADIEMDADLDLVIGFVEGPATVLRNNGDGTFRPLTPFGDAPGIRDFVWADLDGDSDADAATLDDKGVVRVFSNEQAGAFAPKAEPAGLDKVAALAVADLDGDGDADLLALGVDGVVRRAVPKDEGRAWDVAEVARGAPPGAGARLFSADLDNNGAPDLLASGASAGWIALGDGAGHFQAAAVPAGLRVFSVADLDGDGMLDLAGLDAEDKPVLARGRGSKGYHWQVIRPRAKETHDGRINSFGVGGEIQVRAGLLVQKQVIAGPVVHFGLGTWTKSDAARIVWPNGTNQGEFDIPADTAIVAGQRMKGSCPFLYAYDGTSVKFVTDAIWRSPLGLRINAQDTAGASQTEDWVKIRGDQLAPRGGKYDLRITAELWETHYWDHFSLMVVDHPEGTEVFVDERFAREPPKLAVHATGPLVPVSYARDDLGNDVAGSVRDLDGRYLDTFDLGKYQGVAKDHWVEVEVGGEFPAVKPPVLVAQGWIHPTDSSINVALAQGSHEPPRGLSLEVATTDGRWEVARPDLGFPAGKNKTILIPLDGVFRDGAPRRVRLRTNLEIFWDRLAIAAAAPEAALKTNRLAATSADLRFRGYSRMTQAGPGSPELPDYGVLDGTVQRWRDLIGYYTRFGDVRELMKGVDDRYVIANAGDELALLFDAPPPPEAGWSRDFVLVGDGWNKDGDYNTAFSKTVLPLPSHSRPAYDTPPGELEDDPVYRAHAGDWVEYHTRYVTPESFRRGLAGDRVFVATKTRAGAGRPFDPATPHPPPQGGRGPEGSSRSKPEESSPPMPRSGAEVHP